MKASWSIYGCAVVSFSWRHTPKLKQLDIAMLSKTSVNVSGQLHPILADYELASVIPDVSTPPVDHSDAVYLGIKTSVARNLQWIENSATHFCSTTGHYEYIQGVFRSAQSIPSEFWIKFKACPYLQSTLWSGLRMFKRPHSAPREKKKTNTAESYISLAKEDLFARKIELICAGHWTYFETVEWRVPETKTCTSFFSKCKAHLLTSTSLTSTQSNNVDLFIF